MRLLLMFAKKLGKRAVTQLMDKVGGRLVSTMADTSSDAPSAFREPKRDVYSTMNKDESSEDVEQK